MTKQDLPILHQLVADRCEQITSTEQDWPCRRGCDQCCRSLARLPELRRVEWELLEQGLEQLPATRRHEIAQRLAACTAQSAPPYVCPLLDSGSGACLVYAHRPLACRMFGFYRERDKGLYCATIDQRVAAGEFAQTVWGNAESVEARLAGTGELIPMEVWFRSRMA